MIAIRSNGTATPGKTAGKNLPGGAINAMNTASYGRNAVFTVAFYFSVLTILGTNLSPICGGTFGGISETAHRETSALSGT